MGNSGNFSQIEKKYGKDGVDYVVIRHQQRKIYERINDQIERLNDQTKLQQRQDIEYINQERRRLEKNFNDAREEAERKKPGAIKEAEAKAKQNVQSFSGYKQEQNNLDKVEKDVKEKYQKERVKMGEHVHNEVRNYNPSNMKIPEYDNHPDNYKRNIERQCLKKYPDRAKELDTTELERKLTWSNYRQNFEHILDRNQLTKDVDAASSNISKTILPDNTPICC